MHKKNYLLFFVVYAACTVFGCWGEAFGASLAWSHHENNYEIYAPQFSQDNSHLVFVRKLHTPDGHEAELFSKEELQQFIKRRETDNRLEDPEVMLMNVADKSMRRLDYGWDPVFSLDQTKVIYAHQKNPITGFRVLGATLAGNEIRAYEKAGQKIETLARPSSGYLSSPMSVENGTTLFALSDEVNGAWGGNIGVGAVDAATGQQKVLYAPVKEHGLYHLVQKFAMQDNSSIVLRFRPLTTGTYMADSYAPELVESESDSLLYSWGELSSMEKAADFRVCPSGIEVYDGGWRPLPAGKTALSPNQGRTDGLSSPDCAHIATREKEQTVTIRSAQGKPERHWSTREGRIQSLVWSPDSSHIAFVISHGAGFDEKFKYDELVVVKVNEIQEVKKSGSKP